MRANPRAEHGGLAARRHTLRLHRLLHRGWDRAHNLALSAALGGVAKVRASMPAPAKKGFLCMQISNPDQVDPIDVNLICVGQNCELRQASTRCSCSAMCVQTHGPEFFRFLRREMPRKRCPGGRKDAASHETLFADVPNLNLDGALRTSVDSKLWSSRGE